MAELPASPDMPAERSRPWVTWLLCATVIGIFLAIHLQGGDGAARRWGWQPAVEVWRGKPWALLTSALVHVDPIHLVFNVYWLWILGRSVERLMGARRLILFSAAAAFVSSMAQLAWSDQVGIGFSGVGYAMFGVAWVVSLQRPDLGVRVSRQTARVFGIWLLVGIFATYLGLVNFGNAAHVAGGIFGVCAGLAYTERWRSAALSTMGASTAMAAVFAVWAPWSAQWNTARALSAYQRGDYAASIEWFDASLRRGQDPAWVAERKAISHWQAGQPREVQADLEALRKLDAKRAERFAHELEGQTR